MGSANAATAHRLGDPNNFRHSSTLTNHKGSGTARTGSDPTWRGLTPVAAPDSVQRRHRARRFSCASACELQGMRQPRTRLRRRNSPRLRSRRGSLRGGGRRSRLRAGAPICSRAWHSASSSQCHAWCFLPNHSHLLVTSKLGNLSRAMHWLGTCTAQTFNQRHERSGHLYQGRFGSRLIEDDDYLLELARYLPLNPVRAELCDAPEDWPWSSYSATAGLQPHRPGFSMPAPPRHARLSACLRRLGRRGSLLATSLDEYGAPRLRAAASSRGTARHAHGRRDRGRSLSPWLHQGSNRTTPRSEPRTDPAPTRQGAVAWRLRHAGSDPARWGQTPSGGARPRLFAQRAARATSGTSVIRPSTPSLARRVISSASFTVQARTARPRARVWRRRARSISSRSGWRARWPARCGFSECCGEVVFGGYDECGRDVRAQRSDRAQGGRVEGGGDHVVAGARGCAGMRRGPPRLRSGCLRRSSARRPRCRRRLRRARLRGSGSGGSARRRRGSPLSTGS